MYWTLHSVRAGFSKQNHPSHFLVLVVCCETEFPEPPPGKLGVTTSVITVTHQPWCHEMTQCNLRIRHIYSPPLTLTSCCWRRKEGATAHMDVWHSLLSHYFCNRKERIRLLYQKHQRFESSTVSWPWTSPIATDEPISPLSYAYLLSLCLPGLPRLSKCPTGKRT